MFNKIIIITLLGMALSYAAFAQGFDRDKLRYSIDLNANISWFTQDIGIFNSNSPDHGYSSYKDFSTYIRISPFVHVSVDYPLSPKFAVSAGLAYSGRGGSYSAKVKGITVRDNDSDDEVDAENNYNFKIDYVEFPLLVQYDLRSAPDKSFVIYAGIAPAIRVGSATRYVYYPENVTEARVGDTKVKTGGLTNASAFNIHPIFGIQAGDNRDKNGFFVDLHAECSALPVFKSSPAYFDTQMWTISFGFGFRGIFRDK